MKSRLNFILLVSVLFAGSIFTVPTASAAQSPAQTNIRQNGSIYLVTADGKKRPYPNLDIFTSYGWNSLSDVKDATAEDMLLPVGEPMPPRDGKVVCSNRIADNGTCYLITDYKKAPFASMEAMKNTGYLIDYMGDVIYLPTDIPIVTGNEAHRYGALIHMDGTIYFVGKNGLLAFPSETILNSWGYQISDAVPANAADRQKEVKLLMETRVAGEPRPFEPIIPAPLVLDNEDKFIVPFAGKTLPITESWLYGQEERAIHGSVNHGGIDFAGLRGTPVYAAADGYAVTSTHLSVLARKHEDKSVGFGLGEFVQIWHPDQGVYTSYSHLHRVEDKIPYFKPECDDTGFCDPSIVYNKTDYIKRKGVFVKQGELIGHIGDSGLSWGYDEKPREERNIKEDKSWDETHLHFEMYTRDPITFYKAKRYDPFGIYGRLEQYKDESYVGPASLWKLDASGNVELVD